jgi:hypothetical protein
VAGVFETWATRLRLAWNGVKAQAIMGGFAAVFDKSLVWADAAVKMRMPGKASDLAALPLIGSGRLLPQGPTELDADYALRLQYWREQWKFAGTPLGVLLALHFAGFDGLYIVQQNGLAYTLTGTLPTIGANWDPTANLSITTCLTLATTQTSNVAVGHSVPAGVPWFKFDDDTDWCSRFAILIPGETYSAEAYGTATFTGAENGGSVPWPTATFSPAWSQSFTSYRVLVGIPTITDSLGPVAVWADGNSKTNTGVRIGASAPFGGTVDVKAYLSLDANAVALMQSIVSLWRPRKAKCMGIYRLDYGECWDWPPTKTWDTQGSTWDRAPTVATLAGSF